MTWLVTGNSGLNPNTNFLGTTDNQPLVVRTNGAERLRIEAGGNVGLGLNAPRTPLHVLGRIATGLDFTSAGAVTFFPPDGFAWFHIDNGPSGGRPIGRLRFSFGATPGENEVMTILQNSTVGVGTPTPQVKFHVKGNRIRLESADGQRTLDLRADGSALDIQSGGAPLYLHASTQPVYINPYGGNVGVGTTAPAYKLDVAGQVHASDFLITSDAQLKTEVEPLSGALEKLEQVRGVSFQWNATAERLGLPPNERQVGLIAQEVETVFPELVATAGEAGPKAVDYGRLTSVLVEAIRELRAEKDAEIAALQARLARLEAKLDALEASCGERGGGHE